MALLAVAVGGAIGSVLRYLIGLWANQPGWPLGTWLANLIGSFLIGLVYVWGKEKGWLSPELYLLLATGVMGGFTTFSTFSLETVSYFLQGMPWRAGLYILTSVGSGLLAVSCGWWLGRQLL
ncbi:fluoride efflux transporter CrcB [Brevibacillus humidisoli]|uniref:fluoride efflux transporter CrcB n=1 Tax=Brevibacillus humidisoli TaxID=2895522 RepID=UPI001E5A4D97|nr:fluoride efflux transporter CrcB [Brevibacillus humidisoli]UFJ42257.1 fluoride efflux transporter CrcB [Brevibacillus humidisoli]